MDGLHYLVATWWLIALLATLDHANCKCKFPDFLQTRNTDTWWLHHVTYAGAQTSNNTIIYIDFYGDKMILTSLSGPMAASSHPSYKRECVQQTGNNTFLTRHFQKNRTTSFICVQFYQRSDFVVQILTSNYSSEMKSELCQQDLVLDPWPLLKYEDKNLNKTSCMINGGYNMVILDKHNQEVCEDRYITPRVENTCFDNNMLYFDFGKCHIALKKIGMELKQKVACIANWSMGGHYFTILRRVDTAMFWMLKTEKEAENTYSAYVTSDIITQTDEVTNFTPRYVKIELRKKIFDSTCVDISPSCENQHMCEKHDPFAEVFCKKTCGFCANITSYYIDRRYHGVWRTVWDEEQDMISESWMNITADGVYFPEHGRAVVIGKDELTSSHSLLVPRSNGCYPKLYCLRLRMLSRSVILYKLHQGATWPMFHNMAPCGSPYGRHQVGGGHITPAVRDEHFSEPCGIPGVNHTFLAILNDGSNCHGYLTKPTCREEKSKFVTIEYTQCKNKDHEGIHHFTCLAHMPSVTNKEYVLAVDEGSHKYVCLYFSGEMHELVVLPPAACHDNHLYGDMISSLQFTSESTSCTPAVNSSELEEDYDCQADRDYTTSNNEGAYKPKYDHYQSNYAQPNQNQVGDKVSSNDDDANSLPSEKGSVSGKATNYIEKPNESKHYLMRSSRSKKTENDITKDNVSSTESSITEESTPIGSSSHTQHCLYSNILTCYVAFIIHSILCYKG